MTDFYNISNSLLDSASGKLNYITNLASASACDLGINTVFKLIILPILCFLIFLILVRYKDFIMIKYLGVKSKLGYIKILFIKENKTIEEKLVKLDKYNTFNIGKRKFSLEKMHDFIIGYDKNSFPVFMYDIHFILPLKIERKTIDKFINDSVDMSGLDENKKIKRISQIIMAIDSTILKTVYDKKLMSDLYSISTDDSKTKRIMIFVILGAIIFLILYYTGGLDKLLNILGVHI